ncbi:unnamed protein product [Amoebophrya sp. A120]|nr:unnamed protein product [Amoebophrya sp. A120]|eukprot:GSA120T00022711001.1
MPTKRTKCELYHSSNAAAAIRRSGGLKGTKNDANPSCAEINMTKVWACAESKTEICCKKRSGERFKIEASDLKKISNIWDPYRPRNQAAYRNASKTSNHVFYNIFLVPKKKKLSRRQNENLVRADGSNNDPVRFYWNRGDMYFLEFDEDDDDSSSSDSSSPSTKPEERRHVHVAICTSFLDIKSAGDGDDDDDDDSSSTSDNDDDTDSSSDSTDVNMNSNQGGDDSSSSCDQSDSDSSSSGAADDGADSSSSDSSSMSDCISFGKYFLYNPRKCGKKSTGNTPVPFLLDGSARAGGFDLDTLMKQEAPDSLFCCVGTGAAGHTGSILGGGLSPSKILPPLEELAALLPAQGVVDMTNVDLDDFEQIRALDPRLDALLGSVGTSAGAIKFDDAATQLQKKAQFAKVLQLVFAHADSGQEITLSDVLTWHRTIMGREHGFAGRLRGPGVGVHCGKTRFPPGGARVEKGMDVLLRSINELLDDLTNEPMLDPRAQQDRVMRVCAFSVVHLTTLHPFRDGNGRLSRLLVLHLLRRTGLAAALPALVEVGEKRGRFVAALETSRCENGNVVELSEFIEECCYSSLLSTLRYRYTQRDNEAPAVCV